MCVCARVRVFVCVCVCVCMCLCVCVCVCVCMVCEQYDYVLFLRFYDCIRFSCSCKVHPVKRGALLSLRYGATEMTVTAIII